jgi:hypothetical protein
MIPPSQSHDAPFAHREGGGAEFASQRPAAGHQRDPRTWRDKARPPSVREPYSDLPSCRPSLYQSQPPMRPRGIQHVAASAHRARTLMPEPMVRPLREMKRGPVKIQVGELHARRMVGNIALPRRLHMPCERLRVKPGGTEKNSPSEQRPSAGWPTCPEPPCSSHQPKV